MVSPPIQAKWQDQALWGCHFLTPLKVIQLFLLVKRFCFLAKPVLVIGICQYEWIYCVPTAVEAQAHAPHMAATGAGGGPADNQDPRNCMQALRLETGCWGEAVLLMFGYLPQPWQNDEDTLCAARRQPYKTCHLRGVALPPLGTEPICPTVSEITPPASKGVSIVTCAFGRQVVHMGPCNSSHNSLFHDREAGSESGSCDSDNQEDCFSKNFCQWPLRILCVRHLRDTSKFRQLSDSKLNT